VPRPQLPPSHHAHWDGWFVDDGDGRHIGALKAVYEDDETAMASWLLIRLARFSTRYALVPPATVIAVDGRIWIPYTRETVERAPLLFEPPASIARSLEVQLRRHYGLAAGTIPEIHASAPRKAA